MEDLFALMDFLAALDDEKKRRRGKREQEPAATARAVTRAANQVEERRRSPDPVPHLSAAAAGASRGNPIALAPLNVTAPRVDPNDNYASLYAAMGAAPAPPAPEPAATALGRRMGESAQVMRRRGARVPRVSAATLPRSETTHLSEGDEQRFREWARGAGVQDVDNPQSFYDYRGYWRDIASRGLDPREMHDDGLHFPDTYKQHGHPTFSVESRYSAGPDDGGRWDGEAYIPAVRGPRPTLPELRRTAVRGDAAPLTRPQLSPVFGAPWQVDDRDAVGGVLPDERSDTERALSQEHGDHLREMQAMPAPVRAAKYGSLAFTDALTGGRASHLAARFASLHPEISYEEALAAAHRIESDMGEAATMSDKLAGMAGMLGGALAQYSALARGAGVVTAGSETAATVAATRAGQMGIQGGLMGVLGATQASDEPMSLEDRLAAGGLSAAQGATFGVVLPVHGRISRINREPIGAPDLLPRDPAARRIRFNERMDEALGADPVSLRAQREGRIVSRGTPVVERPATPQTLRAAVDRIPPPPEQRVPRVAPMSPDVGVDRFQMRTTGSTGFAPMAGLAAAGVGAAGGAALDPENRVRGAIEGGLLLGTLGWGAAAHAEALAQLTRETAEQEAALRGARRYQEPVDAPVVTREALESGSAVLPHRFNPDLSARIERDPASGTYAVVEQGGTAPRTVRDLPDVAHANAYAQAMGFHGGDFSSPEAWTSADRAGVTDISGAARDARSGARGPEPSPSRDTGRTPLPLPPLHPDIDPTSVKLAWDVVSARYPRLTGMIRGIGPLDPELQGRGAGAGYNTLTRELGVVPDAELPEARLFHELTHAAQDARRKIGVGINADPETVRELEDFAYRVQRAHEAGAARGEPIDTFLGRAVRAGSRLLTDEAGTTGEQPIRRRDLPASMRVMPNLSPSAQQAWLQGERAGKMLLPRDVNQHPEGSPEWKAFEQGWRSQQPRQRGAEFGLDETPQEPERVVNAALRVRGDKVFTGGTHGEALVAAEDAGAISDAEADRYDAASRGPGKLFEDLFVTDRGRYVTREEARAMTGQPRGEAYLMGERLPYFGTGERYYERQLRDAGAPDMFPSAEGGRYIASLPESERAAALEEMRAAVRDGTFMARLMDPADGWYARRRRAEAESQPSAPAPEPSALSRLAEPVRNERGAFGPDTGRNGDKLYHGTLRENVSAVEDGGLQPRVGAFSRQMYGDYEDLLTPAVHLADREQIGRAVTAMRAQVAERLGRSPRDVTDADLAEHGALVVARPNDSVRRLDHDDTLLNREGDFEYADRPVTVEPGDYFTTGNLHPDRIITGSRLARVLRAHSEGRISAGASNIAPLTSIVGGGAGAAYGYTQGDSPEERALNALAYGAGGAVAGGLLPGALVSAARHAGNEVGAFNPGGRGLERFPDGELRMMAQRMDGDPAQEAILAELRSRDASLQQHMGAVDDAQNEAGRADVRARAPQGRRYFAEPTTGGNWRVMDAQTGEPAEPHVGGFDAQRRAEGIAQKMNLRRPVRPDPSLVRHRSSVEGLLDDVRGDYVFSQHEAALPPDFKITRDGALYVIRDGDGRIVAANQNPRAAVDDAFRHVAEHFSAAPEKYEAIRYTAHSDGSFDVTGFRGDEPVLSENLPPEALDDVLGRELADRVRRGDGSRLDDPRGFTTREISDPDAGRERGDRGAASGTALRGIAGASTGAVVGAASDDEDRARGAAIGAVAGLGVGLAPEVLASVRRVAGNEIGAVGDLDALPRSDGAGAKSPPPFQPPRRASAYERAVTLWKAGLLTSLRTHETNIASNVGMAVGETAKDAPAVLGDRVLSAAINNSAVRRALRIPQDAPRLGATKALGRSLPVIGGATVGAAVGASRGDTAGERVRNAAVGAAAGGTAALAGVSWRGALKGLRMAREVMAGRAPDTALNRFEVRESPFTNPILKAYTDVVFRSLGAEDQVFRNMALDRSLHEQAQVVAKNEGLRGRAATRRAEGLYQRATQRQSTDLELTSEDDQQVIDAMSLRAVADADVATFQDKTHVGDALTAIGKIPVFGPITAPFGKTPGAVTTRIVEYSPAGFIISGANALRLVSALKAGATPEEAAIIQRYAAETFGRAATGSSMIGLGYVLGRLGMATGAYPVTDQQQGAQWQLNGTQENSIKIGDTWHEYGRLAPLGNLWGIGATIAQMERNGSAEGLGGKALGGMAATAQAFTDQPFLQGAERITDALKDPGGRPAQQYWQSQAASVFPAGLASVARMVDPVVRQPETVGQALQTKIPLLSRRVPAKVDVLGREVRRSGGALGEVLPMRQSRDRTNDSPVQRVLAEHNVVPNRLKREDGETMVQFRDRSEAVGRANASAVQLLSGNQDVTAEDLYRIGLLHPETRNGETVDPTPRQEEAAVEWFNRRRERFHDAKGTFNDWRSDPEQFDGTPVAVDNTDAYRAVAPEDGAWEVRRKAIEDVLGRVSARFAANQQVRATARRNRKPPSVTRREANP